jgi:hypothetical protein
LYEEVLFFQNHTSLKTQFDGSTYKSTKKNMVIFEDYWLEESITIEITDRRRNRALTANPTSAEYGTSETDALRRIT